MSSDDLARHAALRLGNELDHNLPAILEAQIQAGDTTPKRFEPGTTIALASLILTAAKFAWDIYRDIKKDAKAVPTPDVIARRIRLQLDVAQDGNAARRDKVIAVVVDELLQRPPTT